ncbi:MAG: hypothetical protein SOY06_06530 [Prevotella sp.]|nr:hypothetical protein [Bacteroidales bacterium]MDY4229486.1 hypothetical protein [Prevotella sp.]
MKLMTMLQAYPFDELMPVINEMFPGTAKYKEQLRQGYDLMLAMRPVPSKKSIRYEVMRTPNSDLGYMGAQDSCFTTTWEVCLGKEVTRGKGVDLSDIEMVSNSFVNMCLQGRYPKEFEQAHRILMQND